MWMNVDPLAEMFAGWSPYNYTMNNPINMVDPDGRAPLDWYLNLKTGNYEWHDGTAQKQGFVNLSSTTNRKESITGGTADGKFSTSLNANGSFSINGKEYKKGSSATYGSNNNFEITSNLNLKEKALKFTSDIVAPIIETPQDIIFPIINQISVIANEGVHEGKAYNSDNVPLPNTYELNSWSLESGRSNQSTGNPTYQEGQEIINNTASVIMLPVKAADNPATNFIIKTAVKKAVKEGMKAIE